MKKDLLTTVLSAILGVVVSYIVVGIFIPELKSVSFKALNSDTTYTIASPDPEVFNYRAINPTVEVYVGQCEEYSASGECLDGFRGDENTPETPENPETPETPENPENPETPESPENPETPETPEAPENPETPSEPSGEEADNGTTN